LAIFAIKTAGDFQAKAQEDIRLLLEKINDSSRAMNAILSACHLHEWVWAQWLKAGTPKRLNGTLIRDKKDFLAWLDVTCPHFKTLQELANGSKHCIPVHSTQEIAGYGRGPYGIGPYGASYLLIDKGASLPLVERWLVASEMLAATGAFWAKFFSDNGPIP
jgi:hypothetical protein